MTEEVLELLPLQIPNSTGFIEPEVPESLKAAIQNIPNQLAFKIGTAAEIIGVKTHVLRFWEKEFEALRPKKSNQGLRMYSRREIETALMIKKLLYEDRFSIEGARARLKELRTKVRAEMDRAQETELKSKQNRAQLREIESELNLILTEIRSYKNRLQEAVS